jgi:hypothetical protein
MTFDELLENIATEPDFSETKEVTILSPEMRDPRQRKGLNMAEMYAHPSNTRGVRTFRHGHVLGPPATAESLRAWYERWPTHRLPEDLIALLMRANGIHLSANLDDGRAYIGLSPLEEWLPANARPYGPLPDGRWDGDRCIVLTYDTDGHDHVLLDVDSAEYFATRDAGSNKNLVGHSVGDLLDLLWRERIKYWAAPESKKRPQ